MVELKVGDLTVAFVSDETAEELRRLAWQKSAGREIPQAGFQQKVAVEMRSNIEPNIPFSIHLEFPHGIA